MFLRELFREGKNWNLKIWAHALVWQMFDSFEKSDSANSLCNVDLTQISSNVIPHDSFRLAHYVIGCWYPPFKLIKQEKQINRGMCSPCLFWSYECWENVIRCVCVVNYGRNITYGKVKCQQLPKYQQPRMRLHRPDVRCINMSSLIYSFNLQDGQVYQ